MTQSDNAASLARPQDEMLPFLNNFHDIFTTIGILILLGGLGASAGQIMTSLGLPEGEQAWQLALMGLIAAIAIIVWLLSALLVGRQRRILPGMVLSGAFAVSATIILVWAYVQYLVHGAGIDEVGLETMLNPAEGMEFSRDSVAVVLDAMPWSIRALPVVLALATFLPVAVYYVHFRLPFAGGLAGVGLVSLAAAAAFTLDPYSILVNLPAVGVACGGALFLAGIVFDMRDPGRESRLSGTAFWLHFFAAPMLLSAVLNVTQLGWTLDAADFENMDQSNLMAAMIADNADTMRLALVALSVIGVFALVSLLINRRALIVSGLLTAGVSIGVIVNSVGLGTGAVVAITMLVLGGVVVLLGAAWNPVRQILLTPFPGNGPLARIFPPANGAVG